MRAERSTERVLARPSWFGRLAGLFIPGPVLEAGGEPLRRSRLVARICLVLALLSVAPILVLVVGGHGFVSSMNTANVLAAAFGLLLLRRGVRPEAVATLVVGTHLVSFAASAWRMGGIQSPPAHLLLLMPLLAWFLVGRRAGLIVAFLTTGCFAALAWRGYDPASFVTERTVGLIVVNAVILAVVNALDLGHQEARQELDEANAEIMATNADLVAARDAAERALEVRSALLAAVSHEVRTPMSGILGVSDLLLQDELEPALRERVDLIRQAGEAIMVLTNDILDFSKLEANKVDLERVEVDVVALAEEVVSLMRPRAREKRLRLSSTFDVLAMPQYVGDPGRLRQVLLNLVSNALKFTERGEVQVRVAVEWRSPDADHVRFEVRDTGIGMTAAQQAVIFDAFAQAESSTTRKYGGTGLGLAICTNLVALMKGKLRVDSAPGQGSSFWFTIPLDHAEPLADEAVRAAESTLTGDGSSSIFMRAAPLSVLLVEDELISRKVVAALLERLGCRVATAHNGQEALDAVQARRYDVVLMDCEMPVMNGFEATGRIRALDGPARRVPVIAMTGHAMEGDRERCLEAGMSDYLSKPIRRRALMMALRPYLREAAAEQVWDSMVEP